MAKTHTYMDSNGGYIDIESKVRQAREAGSSGDNAGACAILRELYRNGQLPEYEFNDYGWRIYFHIKELMATKGASDRIKRLLMDYIELRNKPSRINALVLSLAEKLSEGKDGIKFAPFLRLWVERGKLGEEDWMPQTGRDGKTYEATAVRAVKIAVKSFDLLAGRKTGDFRWLMNLTEKAVEMCPEDDWLARDKAKLHLRAGEKVEAEAIYRNLVRKMPDKVYIWKEMADCCGDAEVRIGLLSKAISLGNEEDFIGKVRLQLAETLIGAGDFDCAAVELRLFRDHYSKRGWRIGDDVEALQSKCPQGAGAKLKDNRNLYEKYIPVAEEYVYVDVPTMDAVLVTTYKNASGKERLIFVDGIGGEFNVGRGRFPALRKACIGQVWRFRLIKDEKGLSPLTVAKSDRLDWDGIPQKYGLVQYVNVEKRFYHVYSTDGMLFYEKFAKQKMQAGNFVKFRQIIRPVRDKGSMASDKGKIGMYDVRQCQREEALPQFPFCDAVVDRVTEEKQTFRVVLKSIGLTATVRFDQIARKPSVGDSIGVRYVEKTIPDKNRLGSMKKFAEILEII